MPARTSPEDRTYHGILLLSVLKEHGGKAKYLDILSQSGLNESQVLRTKWWLSSKGYVECELYKPYIMTEEGKEWLEEQENRIDSKIDEEVRGVQ